MPSEGNAHGWIPCGREAWLKRSKQRKQIASTRRWLCLIVGYAVANDAKESVSAGVIVVFGAARGAYCPNAADQMKPHNRPRVLQRCSPFRPFCVSTTQRHNAQRRAATFTTSSLSHRPHTAPVPHVQRNRDRDRHRKRDHDNKQQQRDGHSGVAVSCGTGTAWGGWDRLGLRGSETIAIFGQGAVGLSGTQLAPAMGARVIALDIDSARLNRAKGVRGPTRSSTRNWTTSSKRSGTSRAGTEPIARWIAAARPRPGRRP